MTTLHKLKYFFFNKIYCQIKEKAKFILPFLLPHFFKNNLRIELQKIATKDTAIYIKQNLSGINAQNNRLSVHEYALKKVLISNGLVLEFGVFTGFTLNFLAFKKPNWKIEGFDSFEGLPQFWNQTNPKGKFSISGKLPPVLRNVSLNKGLFEESIPIYLSTLNNTEIKIKYLHIDCDLYSSTKTIFNLLRDFIASGTVIVFDEYFNYHGWENGEFKAFQEFVKENSINYEYITYNYLGCQVALRIK